MTTSASRVLFVALVAALLAHPPDGRLVARQAGATLTLTSDDLQPWSASDTARALTLDGLFYETVDGRSVLPATLTATAPAIGSAAWNGQTTMPDGRTVSVTITPDADRFTVRLDAQPADGITGWGLAVDAAAQEYYTGLMERVVDGPQRDSWAPDITAAMDLRGQAVELLVKPTTSIYAPFFLSSRGYAVGILSDWPGHVDFAAADPGRVGLRIDGPSLELTIYTSGSPAALVEAHALDAGPPFLPPAWIYRPWRWRDEHRQRETYYDGTPVTGPFNAEVMEDVLMMEAFGIPNGVYWIDRPWGLGENWGYDDFEIDPERLPHFPDMVRWLESRDSRTGRCPSSC